MHTPDYLENRLRPGVRLTLEPLRETLERLGHPERAVPVVLIGGTNGKGSTQAFLASILAAAGLRVGTFTSPSLEDFHELVTVEGRRIRPEVARPLAERALEAAGPAGLTLFEAATAVAFLAFAEAGLELAVVEVGLGGRGDATNLCDPVVSILTNVALEHRLELGDTVEAIAWQKVGIVRPGRPLITGVAGGALAVIEDTCRALGAPVDLLDRDFSMNAGTSGLEYRSEGLTLAGLELGLAGMHQPANAALAVRAAWRLAGQGYALPEEAIRRGLREARLAGRLEWMTGPDGLRVLVDGAHNPHGAAALAWSLEALGLPRPRRLAMAVYADKEVEAMLERLLPQVDQLVCTRSAQPRCLDPETLAARARAVMPGFDVRVAGSIAEAVAGFRAAPAATHVVAGSLSVVEEARRAVMGGA